MQNQQVKYPTQFVKLPSKGLVYPQDSIYSSGEIELRYPTAQDENILTSRPLIQKGIVIDVFIKNLLTNPSINIDDLILGDKNALIISSRILAYGNQYRTKYKCPQCDHQHQSVFDLNQLLNKEIDQSLITPGTNQFKFTLPLSNKVLTFKLLTSGQDNEISNIIKNQKNISGVDQQLTTRLKYMIISVDGNSEKSTIIKTIRQMPARDSLAFRTHVRQLMPDIDMQINYNCESCGYFQKIQMPINYDFFYPTR